MKEMLSKSLFEKLVKKRVTEKKQDKHKTVLKHWINTKKIKLERAYGGCLGTCSRRRTQ